MSAWTYVAASYVVVLAALALLVLRSAQRGRKLAREVPPDQRRWS